MGEVRVFWLRLMGHCVSATFCRARPEDSGACIASHDSCALEPLSMAFPSPIMGTALLVYSTCQQQCGIVVAQLRASSSYILVFALSYTRDNRSLCFVSKAL